MGTNTKERSKTHAVVAVYPDDKNETRQNQRVKNYKLQPRTIDLMVERENIRWVLFHERIVILLAVGRGFT